MGNNFFRIFVLYPFLPFVSPFWAFISVPQAPVTTMHSGHWHTQGQGGGAGLPPSTAKLKKKKDFYAR